MRRSHCTSEKISGSRLCQWDLGTPSSPPRGDFPTTKPQMGRSFWDRACVQAEAWKHWDQNIASSHKVYKDTILGIRSQSVPFSPKYNHGYQKNSVAIFLYPSDSLSLWKQTNHILQLPLPKVLTQPRNHQRRWDICSSDVELPSLRASPILAEVRHQRCILQRAIIQLWDLDTHSRTAPILVKLELLGLVILELWLEVVLDLIIGFQLLNILHVLQADSLNLQIFSGFLFHDPFHVLLAADLLLFHKRGLVHLVDLLSLSGRLRSCRGSLLLNFPGFLFLCCSLVVLWLLLLKDVFQRQAFARSSVKTVVHTLLLIVIIIRLKECFLGGHHMLMLLLLLLLRWGCAGCCFRLCFPLGCSLLFGSAFGFGAAFTRFRLGGSSSASPRSTSSSSTTAFLSLRRGFSSCSAILSSCWSSSLLTSSSWTDFFFFPWLLPFPFPFAFGLPFSAASPLDFTLSSASFFLLSFSSFFCFSFSAFIFSWSWRVSTCQRAVGMPEVASHSGRSGGWVGKAHQRKGPNRIEHDHTKQVENKNELLDLGPKCQEIVCTLVQIHMSDRQKLLPPNLAFLWLIQLWLGGWNVIFVTASIIHRHLQAEERTRILNLHRLSLICIHRKWQAFPTNHLQDEPHAHTKLKYDPRPEIRESTWDSSYHIG